MLQGSNALNGDSEAPGESHFSVSVAARYFDPAVEVLGDLADFGLVVWCVGDAGLEAANNSCG